MYAGSNVGDFAADMLVEGHILIENKVKIELHRNDAFDVLNCSLAKVVFGDKLKAPMDASQGVIRRTP